MRDILCLLLILSFAAFSACQTVSSSTIYADTSTAAGTKITRDHKVPKLNKRSADSHDPFDGLGHDDEAKRISLADAKKAFDNGTALFIDTRSNASYLNEHIKGAINIPVAELENRYKEVPRGRKIIAYCS